MDLAIIILNWNAADDTVRCVRNILAWHRLTTTVFVVDNASDDGSVEVINRECPYVHLICNEENLGFAGGTNRGIDRALAASNAPILLLNNDASIQETDVIRLLDTLTKRPDIGIIGPLLFDAEQPDRLISAGSKNPIKHHHTLISTVPAGNPVRTVEFLSGTTLIVQAEVFRSVGLLDEKYFFSTELADLCLRARQHGYCCAVDTRARAHHHLSRSSDLRDTLYVYYIVRNRFIFIRNWPHKSKLLYFLFWTIYSAALWLKLRINGNQSTAQAIWLGLGDGLQGRFGGQNDRVISATSNLTRPAVIQS